MNWFRQIFTRRRLYGDLSEEIRAHLDEKIDELVASGLPRDEAEHAARRAFGNVLLNEQTAREVWRWPAFENLLIDARCAVRARGAFLAIEILLLAVGFAVALLAFSETRYALDPSLRVPHPNRTYFVGQGNDTPPQAPVVLLKAWRKRTSLFSAIGGFFVMGGGMVNMGSGPAAIDQALITRGMLNFLPRKLAAGRPFADDDFIHPQIASAPVLVTHSFLLKTGLTASEAVGRVIHWQTPRYQHIFVVSTPDKSPPRLHQIVGVLPNSARFPYPLQPDILIPWSPGPGREYSSDLWILAELRPDLRPGQVAQALTANLPRSPKGQPPLPVTLAPIQAAFDKGEVKIAEYGLAVGTLTLMLLIAASSLVELLGTTRRRKEFSMKLVLGASPGRLFLERAVEIFVVCSIGLAVGVYLLHYAWPVTSTIWTTKWTSVPKPGLFLLSAVASLLVFSCIAIATGPNFVLKKLEPRSALKEGGSTVSRPARRVRMIVIALQIAVCVGFALSAARFAAQLHTLATKPLGLHVHNLWDGNIHLPRFAKPAKAQALLTDLRARLDSIPGVSGAAFSSELPATGSHDIVFSNLAPPGPPPPPPSLANPPHNVDVTFVDTEYLQLLGCKLLQGRYFTPQDRPAAPEAPPPLILSEPEASRLFGNRRAAGEQVQLGWSGKDFAKVLGVVSGMRSLGLGKPLTAEAFAPLQGLYASVSVTVRTSKPGFVPLADIRRVLSSALPGATLSDFRSLASRYDSELQIPRRRFGLLAVFALIASLVAVVGLASILFTSIREKDLEIGIRRALGASNRDLALSLLRSLMPWVALGTILGVALPVWYPTPFGLNAGASGQVLAAAEVAVMAALGVLILASLWLPLRRAFRRPISDLLRAE